jgi:hypothetical protein
MLQQGVALYEANQRDEARKAFMRAAALAPTLELSEGFYSPSVRGAFEKAKTELGKLEPGIPPPREVLRICRAGGLRGMVVVSMEHLGARPVLRLAVFDARAGKFTATQTAVIEEDDPTRAGVDVAARLRVAVADAAGVPYLPPPSLDGGMVAPDDRDEDPWYIKHWWIWPVAAAVVATAVTLPLTVFREDVVDVKVRF